MGPWKIFSIMLFLVILVVAAFFFMGSGGGPCSRVCFNESCVLVEVPAGGEAMARGLMFRERLDEDRGMLFIFPREGRYSFWMRNMNFPIDMLWLTSGGRVVHIERDVPPCGEGVCPGYSPEEEAKYVLEVAANYSLRHNISLNSTASFFR